MPNGGFGIEEHEIASMPIWINNIHVRYHRIYIIDRLLEPYYVTFYGFIVIMSAHTTLNIVSGMNGLFIKFGNKNI
ncbi:MAG: hypothetical protein LBB45_05465 [Methanobrevibacter sp.]|jgi:hypothetical protein|nr:hypothetical protein [Candidatus Methanovirga basalitermitum]